MAERDTIPTNHPAADGWRDFKEGQWQRGVDVSDFIQKNVTPYLGDAEFLAGATPRTTALWAQLSELFVTERERGVLDVSPIPSSITAHDAGYINKDSEIIVGLQFGNVFAFSVIVETVFQWPGLGLLVIQAIQFADVPLLAAYIVLVALCFAIINLIVDILYAYIDPRVRYE